MVAFGTKMFFGGERRLFFISVLRDVGGRNFQAVKYACPEAALQVCTSGDSQLAVGISDSTASPLSSQEPAATPETWTTLA